MKNKIKIPSVGDILLKEFLEPLGLSQSQLAAAIHVPRARINALVHGRYSVSAEIDLLLCKFFRLSDGYWLRIQDTIDLMQARRRMSGQLQKVIPYHGVMTTA